MGTPIWRMARSERIRAAFACQGKLVELAWSGLRQRAGAERVRGVLESVVTVRATDTILAVVRRDGELIPDGFPLSQVLSITVVTMDPKDWERVPDPERPARTVYWRRWLHAHGQPKAWLSVSRADYDSDDLWIWKHHSMASSSGRLIRCGDQAWTAPAGARAAADAYLETLLG